MEQLLSIKSGVSESGGSTRLLGVLVCELVHVCILDLK